MLLMIAILPTITTIFPEKTKAQPNPTNKQLANGADFWFTNENQSSTPPTAKIIFTNSDPNQPLTSILPRTKLSITSAQ